jgi:uncharacterized membrane protein YebE (DUF533 family)
MQGLFDPTGLGLNHVQVIVRGMYAVAACDGTHQAEQVMVRQFYAACQSDAHGLADFDQVVARPFDAGEAAEILGTPALRRTFLASCLLLAFADGAFSEAERRTIDGFARDLDVPAAEIDALREEVTDHLLQQIARVRNVDALKEVAQELSH